MKLSNAERNRLLARSLFVDADKNIKQIAETLGVSTKTISNYQSIDKKEGFDWLTLKASKHIQNSQEEKQNMFGEFVSYMYSILKEIREDETLDASQKADKIVSVADGFSKMRKVAAHEDPEAYKLGIVKHTIKTMLDIIKDNIDQECLEVIIDCINEKQDELADVSI
ncbi:DUF1804 family protein [Sulfurimonas sp.]